MGADGGDAVGQSSGPDHNEAMRLGYQLASFRDITNSRFIQLEASMSAGFAQLRATIESQQYITRDRYDGDQRTQAVELDTIVRTQAELRGTIIKLWWLLGATVIANIAQAALGIAMARGGP